MDAIFNNNQEAYIGREPPWYEPESIDGLEAIMNSYQLIKEELFQILSCPDAAKKCFQKNTLRFDKGWRQIELKIYGVEYPERIKFFPKTMSLLDSIEGLSTIYFSLLAPDSSIKPHIGDTDAYYRVHLGLKIPASLPDCGLEVAGQKKSWQEGQCLAFNDMYCHTAWNNTSEERVVLILDILRPNLRNKKRFIEAGVRATLYYSRLYALFWPLLELLPRIVTRFIRPTLHSITFLWHCYRSR